MDVINLSVVVYAAGFFDGEGAIYFHPSGMRAKCCVKMAQKSLAPLEFIQSHFGGRIYGGQGPKRNGNELHFRGELAVSFLQAVRPYLLVKADKADRFIAMYR